MKKILLNKIGFEHYEEWKNCQDYGFINESIKCVVDGCSEGKHSEVGAKLFCHLFQKNENIEEIFTTLLTLFPTFDEVKNHLLFTLLFVKEDEENFYVHSVGDGYIIKENKNGEISYEKIDYDNSPPYFAYNYIEKEYLKKYKEGVPIEKRIFPKSEYKTIGVATDGLHYVLKSHLKMEFEQLLKERKEFAIKRLLNRHLSVCKDDITIAI